MSLRTVLLIALGGFLAGLAVCLRDYRLPLVLAESLAFFFAGPEVLAHARALGRVRRR